MWSKVTAFWNIDRTVKSTCYADLDCYLNSHFKDKQIIAGFLCLIKFSYFYTFLKKNYITRRGGVF